MGTISGCRHLKVNLMAKIDIYVNLLPKGAQTKLFKFFCSKIFSICHRCRWHRWCTLSHEYLREFSKKFEMAVIVYSDAWGKLIHEKNQQSKISWHCPFKCIVNSEMYMNNTIFYFLQLVKKYKYLTASKLSAGIRWCCLPADVCAGWGGAASGWSPSDWLLLHELHQSCY